MTFYLISSVIHVQAQNPYSYKFNQETAATSNDTILNQTDAFTILFDTKSPNTAVNNKAINVIQK